MLSIYFFHLGHENTVLGRPVTQIIGLGLVIPRNFGKIS